MNEIEVIRLVEAGDGKRIERRFIIRWSEKEEPKWVASIFDTMMKIHEGKEGESK